MTPKDTDKLQSRIKDEELRSFATSAHSEKAAVTIELDLPFPKVELGRGGPGMPKELRPKRVVEESAEETEAAQEIERAARAAIEKIVKGGVNWLELGKAGFTRVSADELRQLVDVEGIRFIHPRPD